MLFGGRCAVCASKDRLEIDHVNPKTKISHKIWSWSLPKLLSELAKCQLLCKDCHISKSCIELFGDAPKMHGKVATYERHGCRCDLCKTAKREKRLYYGEISGNRN